MSRGPYVIRYSGDARPEPTFYRPPMPANTPSSRFWSYDPTQALLFATKADAEMKIAAICSGLTRADTHAVPLAEVAP